jgi:DNA-binding LytR/AlgR family response regulator
VNTPNCDPDRFMDPVAEVSIPPLRILVVEDEGLIALNLELILRRFGCEIVGPISEVDDIVSAVRTHRPDGAFLDVNLRGRKVFDVLPEMIGLGIPCVLSSGYDDPMLFPPAYRNMPRIAKPFDEIALRRACVEFGSLAEARQAAAPATVGTEDQSGKPRPESQSIGEGQAVAFPLHRRFPPTLPIDQDEDSRAVVGLR